MYRQIMLGDTRPSTSCTTPPGPLTDDTILASGPTTTPPSALAPNPMNPPDSLGPMGTSVQKHENERKRTSKPSERAHAVRDQNKKKNVHGRRKRIPHALRRQRVRQPTHFKPIGYVPPARVTTPPMFVLKSRIMSAVTACPSSVTT